MMKAAARPANYREGDLQLKSEKFMIEGKCKRKLAWMRKTER